LKFQKPTRHFERSRPAFSSAFAPANAQACAERNLSSLFSAFCFRVFPPLAICPYSIYYLDMLRFDWDERKTSAIGPSTEFGLRRPKAFLAIRTRASSTIPSTPKARIV